MSESPQPTLTRDARARAGRALRKSVPRLAQGVWEPATGRTPAVVTIAAQASDRVATLLPLRYERMARSPLAFFRGSASVMASDLAPTPATGLQSQICGDAHLSNFGAFGTPERNVIFDVNDFDETLRGPWEWDLKRLVASFALAARHVGARTAEEGQIVRSAAAAYRTQMRRFARLSPREIWYAKFDAAGRVVTKLATSQRARELRALVGLTQVADGARRFIDDPPLVYHPSNAAESIDPQILFASYRGGLRPDIAVLFERFLFADLVVKVVGIGSVGTRCYAALFVTADGEPLVLQVKEALASVLEPHLGAFDPIDHGRRVVEGQRLMQAASDIFLGAANFGGRSFYVRQLRDLKASVDIEAMKAADLLAYSPYCGWVLAAAHARSGDAAAISGYLGTGTAFDEAMGTFAAAYADQTERDFAEFVRALHDGTLSMPA